MLSEQGFAVDTNLFVFPAARRLLHGLALETGRRIFILPEVNAEITERKHLGDAELFRWGRRSRKSYKQLRDGRSNHIIEAVEKASIEWYEEELERSDGVFRRLEVSTSQAQDIELIAQTLPKRIFRRFVAGEPPKGDPLIVAQAIFFKIDLLSTNNLNTIDHDELNNWLRSRGWNHDLVHTPSQTAMSLCNQEIERVYEHFLAHATNRIFPDAPSNRAEFLRGLDVLSSAGFGRQGSDAPESDAFKSVVYRLHAQLRNDRDFENRFRKAVASSHRTAAIDAEIRLNRLINLAVGKAEKLHKG